MNNIIAKTGQSWKLIFLLVAMLLAGIAMAYALLSISVLSNTLFYMYMLSGVWIGALGFIYVCFCIQCPTCGDKWFWNAVSGKESGEWGLWLKSLNACPKCGESFDT